ncbi:hypothetical protein KC363_g7913 [Hortaea werneckii]|nr:hypothetical protein KC363_g7913 [Hortaea werneckii]KAI7501616.1 hypothetical protein KC347_g9157 [Hortaea werneckii]
MFETPSLANGLSSRPDLDATAQVRQQLRFAFAEQSSSLEQAITLAEIAERILVKPDSRLQDDYADSLSSSASDGTGHEHGEQHPHSQASKRATSSLSSSDGTRHEHGEQHYSDPNKTAPPPPSAYPY